MLRKLFVVFLVVLAMAVGLSLFLPSRYTVERSREIAATPGSIFPHLVNLRAWAAWDPMHQLDPTIRSTYGDGPSGAVGSWERWSVAGGSGGRRVFTTVESPRRVVLDLAFDQDASIAEMELLLEPGEGSTRVTCRLSGEVGGAPIARWGGLLMDARVGDYYEAGLSNLAQAVAQGPPQVK